MSDYWFDQPDPVAPFDALSVSNLLEVEADQTDDMADHDEIHAAAVIMYAYWLSRNSIEAHRNPLAANRYVLRWADGVARRVGLV